MSLISMGEAANLLGVSRARLRALIEQGKIKAYGNGPARRVELESIQNSGLPIQGIIPGLDGKKKFCPFLSIGRPVLQPCSSACGVYRADSQVCALWWLPVIGRKP